MNTLRTLFIVGGYWYMVSLTAILIILMIALFIAPKWIKEIGLIALTAGFLFQFIQVYPVIDLMQIYGDIDKTTLARGLKVSLYCPIYGLSIYLLSLIFRLTLKNRPTK